MVIAARLSALSSSVAPEPRASHVAPTTLRQEEFVLDAVALGRGRLAILNRSGLLTVRGHDRDRSVHVWPGPVLGGVLARSGQQLVAIGMARSHAVVVVLDHDGGIRWSKRLERSWHPDDLPLVTVVPDGPLLVRWFSRHHVYAFRSVNGDVLWSRAFPDAEETVLTHHGVLVGSDGRLALQSAYDGQEIWSTTVPDGAFPVIADESATIVPLVTTDGPALLDLSTGAPTAIRGAAEHIAVLGEDNSVLVVSADTEGSWVADYGAGGQRSWQTRFPGMKPTEAYLIPSTGNQRWLVLERGSAAVVREVEQTGLGRAFDVPTPGQARVAAITGEFVLLEDGVSTFAWDPASAKVRWIERFGRLISVDPVVILRNGELARPPGHDRVS